MILSTLETIPLKRSKSVSLLFSFLFALSLMSCSTTLNFVSSPVVPAAKGSAKISKDNNNNYAINVKVTNLAQPSRLQPKKELYVVWLVTKNNVTKNIGQLNISSGFFFSTLEGELNTVSSFKADHVFITAENTADLQYPMGTVVLTTKTN